MDFNFPKKDSSLIQVCFLKIALWLAIEDSCIMVAKMLSCWLLIFITSVLIIIKLYTNKQLVISLVIHAIPFHLIIFAISRILCQDISIWIWGTFFSVIVRRLSTKHVSGRWINMLFRIDILFLPWLYFNSEPIAVSWLWTRDWPWPVPSTVSRTGVLTSHLAAIWSVKFGAYIFFGKSHTCHFQKHLDNVPVVQKNEYRQVIVSSPTGEEALLFAFPRNWMHLWEFLEKKPTHYIL